MSESYRRIQKSFPILFRLDPAFQEVVFGEPLGGQISFDSLKSAIHDRLLELDNLFNNEDVNHVYEKLFDIIPQAEPNLIPSAPLYHDGDDDVDGDGDDDDGGCLPSSVSLAGTASSTHVL